MTRGVNMKTCTMCKKEKPYSEFHKDSHTKDGCVSRCKQCRNSGKPRKPPKLLTSVICEKCKGEFTPSSNRQKWCKVCSPIERRKVRLQICKEYYHENKKLKGCHPTGKDSSSYKDGIGLYKKERKDFCERCGNKENLIVHHKDRDRHNNELSNLETLCRKCHFKEHHTKDSLGRFFKSK